ncbi:MAG: type 2 isopentenyl-diphosphate Delta-isomerase [Chitinivibrionales bacterium]|nr:type 2 isopentenyl-diphosphate Delta-isomerase [Chitinivibrionales bacterium]
MTAPESSTISKRKSRQKDICLEPPEPIETAKNRFNDISLLHHPLPEVDWDKLDTTTTFLGAKIALPIFISCMTGGSDNGFRINRDLARHAQQYGIPVGLGSIRVLFRHEEVFDQFYVKPLAPDVPVWANLGAVQLRELDHNVINEMVKRLEVQAMVIHCNAGQEMFQPGGDLNFVGLYDAIGRLCESSPIPVIVKETGFGMRVADVTRLRQCGAAAVDIAGSGGTNWIQVEAQCHEHRIALRGRDFDLWGNPTPAILAALPRDHLPVLASGGVRTGVDIAKSLALGAELAGMALPFLRAQHERGMDGLAIFTESLIHSFKSAMLLCGCQTIEQLQAAKLILSDSFLSLVRQHAAHGEWRSLL